MIFALSIDLKGQVTIAIQDFDGAIPTMTYTGGGIATGNGLFPATPKYVSASNGRQVNNSTSNITFSTVNTTGYTSINYTVNLASFAGTSGNGSDGADYAIVSISTDGGTTWSQELQINGNNNAKWGFSGTNAGTGTATVPYDGNNAPATFSPAGGGYRTTDGYQFLSVTGLPATASLRIRMEFKNNSSNEYWVIDDAKITGIVACTGPTTQASFTSITGIGTTSMTVNFGAGTGGNGRIVVISNAAITATPTSGTTYTANTIYGSGTDIGTNEFVVYDGTGTSVTVTGLNSNTTYYVEIFEYAAGYCYDGTTGGNTGNATTLCAPTTEPTTNASAINFSNILCTSFTINWTSGNGANRIVVISTAAITGTPTDGVNYAANTVYGSGGTIAANEYVAYNGSGTNVTITGLTYGTTYYVTIFEYNGTTANCDENYLTTSVATGTQLLLVAEPTTAASSIVFSTVDCTYMIIDWTAGDGGNAIVVMSTSAITGNPVDQTSYTANSTFGSGSTLNAGEYVVYNGNGTSVTVLGLVAGTTYYVEIFEYNVTTTNCDENYLTSTTVSSSQATASVCCPLINSLLVNSCGASSNEGIDEQVIFTTGSSPLNINDISITYSSAGTYCNTTCGANTNINNATYVNSLNTTAGCTPDLFYYADPIPANSTVIMFTGSPPSTTVDYSGICGSGPYYVVFNNNTSTTGRFANAANANRTTTMDFGGGCSQSVTYYSSNANTGTDGDYAYFDALGNVSYGNNGLCVAGPLPVELINFSGYGNNTTNFLNWSTASEINNDYFDIERSEDGYTFETIGMVFGNGTTTFQNDYSIIDESPYSPLSYYRLKQVDFNGDFEYSNTIVIKSEVSELLIWQANDFLNISTSKEGENIKSLRIYNNLGQLIYTTNNNSISLINTSRWEKGIYLVHIQTENSFFTKKIQFK